MVIPRMLKVDTYAMVVIKTTRISPDILEKIENLHLISILSTKLICEKSHWHHRHISLIPNMRLDLISQVKFDQFKHMKIFFAIQKIKSNFFCLSLARNNWDFNLFLLQGPTSNPSLPPSNGIWTRTYSLYNLLTIFLISLMYFGDVFSSP